MKKCPSGVRELHLMHYLVPEKIKQKFILFCESEPEWLLRPTILQKKIFFVFTHMKYAP